MVGENETVAELIRSTRNDAGLSQAELARRLGTKQSVVSRWERGMDEPRLSTLTRIARACGFRLAIGVEPDDVDRAQIREHLAMTPRQRLRSVKNVSQLVNAARPSK
jgi:transcriptional regulator with XRE-family HTH domain